MAVGESYIFTVMAKRFQFSQTTQLREILDDTEDINFIADEQSPMSEEVSIPQD